MPNILPVTRQNLIAGIDPRQAYASETYTDKKSLDFTIKLAPNTYTNYATMEIVLPVQFVKKSQKTQQLDDDLMPVNNFFCRWFTDIDIKRYPDDVKILPTDKIYFGRGQRGGGGLSALVSKLVYNIGDAIGI